MVEEQISGLQLVVIRDNKIVLSEAMGMANVSFSVPVTKNTLFSINSIAKVFTGTAIMQLVEKGKIGIQKRKTTKAQCPLCLYRCHNGDWFRNHLSHSASWIKVIFTT